MAQDGFEVYLDRKSAIYLRGVTLDHQSGLSGRGFQFTQPERQQHLRLRRELRGMTAARRAVPAARANAAWPLAGTRRPSLGALLVAGPDCHQPFLQAQLTSDVRGAGPGAGPTVRAAQPHRRPGRRLQRCTACPTRASRFRPSFCSSRARWRPRWPKTCACMWSPKTCSSTTSRPSSTAVLLAGPEAHAALGYGDRGPGRTG